MDCEKFESTLLDELYDELDEVTSAAAKRHVGGCSRCASLLSGLKATRRMAVLPIVEPPADLEDRILAAAREAQKVAPLTRRASRVISLAGSWAMRPQTGMAAVFLLGIGLSALLLQGKHAARPATMTVSEQGEPVASVGTETLARPPGAIADNKAVAPSTGFATPPPQPAPTSAASASNFGGDLVADGTQTRARLAGGGGGSGRLNGPAKSAPKDVATLDKGLAGFSDNEQIQNAGGVAGAPMQHSAYGSPAAAPAAPPAAPRAAANDANGFKSVPYPVAQAQSAPPTFASAMGSYNAGDFATATTLFDTLASNGDLTSALWAARSVRDGSGCATAVPRFDQVAKAATGTTPGYDATFEGAQCYKQIGKLDAAQARFSSLLTVTGYVDRAKTELAAMGPKAAAKAAPKPATLPADAVKSQSY